MSGIARNTGVQLAPITNVEATTGYYVLDDAADSMVRIPTGWDGGTLSIWVANKLWTKNADSRGPQPWSAEADWSRPPDWAILHDTAGTPVQIVTPAAGWHRLPQACFPSALLKLVAATDPAADMADARNWLMIVTKT